MWKRFNKDIHSCICCISKPSPSAIQRGFWIGNPANPGCCGYLRCWICVLSCAVKSWSASVHEFEFELAAVAAGGEAGARRHGYVQQVPSTKEKEGGGGQRGGRGFLAPEGPDFCQILAGFYFALSFISTSRYMSLSLTLSLTHTHKHAQTLTWTLSLSLSVRVTLALQSISRLRGPLHALYLHTHVRWSPISNPSALVPLHWLRQEVINKAVKFFFVEKWSN